MVNAYHAGIGFTEQKKCLLSQFLEILMSISQINEPINTRHVCTYLNAFPVVVPNKVMKFHNFDICYKLCAHFEHAVCTLLPRGKH